jgi:hypothetical protein
LGDVNDKQMEMIVTTLTMSLENIAPSTAVAPTSPDFFARLIQSREARANFQVLSYLTSQSDGRLLRLGFSAQDVCDLRDGKLRLRVAS